MNPNFCPYRHTRKIAGAWVRGDESQVVVCRKANNSGIQVSLRCENCHHKCGALPKALWFEWFNPLDATIQIEIGEDFDKPVKPPCVVAGCTSNETEYHHFAPRNTFVNDAEDWPVLPLCRPHHIEWHQRMDGYRWHRRAVSA